MLFGSKAAASKLLLCLLAVPFIVYLAVINHFIVNVPFYDDYSVLIDPLLFIIPTDDASEKAKWLFAPNASHIPAITRLVVLFQALYMDGINFKYTTILGNLGLLLTAIVLMVYFRKKYAAPLLALLPVPFLLLSITHWESMDYVTPAWQMYWGASFFPVICFIAIIEGYAILAASSFIIALFLSSGGLCLYPLLTGFCLLTKRWVSAVKFAVIAGIGLMVFFHFLPIQQGMTETPDLWVVTKFVPAFMGNIISNGNWDLTPYAVIHTSIGIVVLMAGAYIFIKEKDADLFRLIFVYVLLLAGMAIYARGSIYQYVPSRYATFPALAIACFSCHFLMQWLKNPSTVAKIMAGSVLTCVILLWAHSIYVCREPLEFNRKTRSNAMLEYANGNTGALMYLLWSVEYGHTRLTQARDLSIYSAEEWAAPLTKPD